MNDGSNTVLTRDKLRLATEVRPSSRQLAWQRTEFNAFVHYGPNAFTDRSWGTGEEDPDVFAPEDLDADQWVRAAKAAGMKIVVLTAKHHDGFCLWPSRYTDHSVAEGGRYGNGSEVREQTIPLRADREHLDGREFTYAVDDYSAYFMSQLFELLTEYGPVHEVWSRSGPVSESGGRGTVMARSKSAIHPFHSFAPLSVQICSITGISISSGSTPERLNSPTRSSQAWLSGSLPYTSSNSAKS